MRIILLGPPGSGKGTQACLIEERFHLPRISTGDILRRAVRLGTSLGLKAESMMKQGLLVSDDVVVGLVEETVRGVECRRGYVLDGFPRTLAQAESLTGFDGRRPELAVEILVGAEEVVRRLALRRVCPECRAVFAPAAGRDSDRCPSCGGALETRSDDRPEVIRERLRVFEAQTAPLREYYSARGVYRSIPGTGTVDEVFVRIAGLLEGFFRETAGGQRS